MKREKKKINRNPFNEKLLHRYFLEKLYLGDISTKRKLVPDKLGKKIADLNLIVPEDTLLYNGYRSDFTLYFQNDQTGIPVEIKWVSKYFNKINQVNELKEKNGFLVCFDFPHRSDIDIVQIDKDDFEEWLYKRINILWMDAFSDKVESKFYENTWLIVLRGKAFKNFHKMVNYCKKNNETYFWAQRNDRTLMRNIFNLNIGDKIIFILAKTSGNERSKMIINSNDPIYAYEIYVTKVIDPYYMALNWPFFEIGNIPINRWNWPHFFDFIIEKDLIFDPPLELYRKEFIGELKTKFAHSSNKGGILYELTQSEAQYLLEVISINTPRSNSY